MGYGYHYIENTVLLYWCAVVIMLNFVTGFFIFPRTPKQFNLKYHVSSELESNLQPPDSKAKMIP